MYTSGARKFYVMAYNSRYSQLNFTEIFELNEKCIRFVKKLDRECVVVVGDPIHCSTRESIKFALHAKEYGADLISLIMREKYFTDDQVLDHYAQIGREANMPILIHEMPFLSGSDGTQMHWPESLVRQLPKINEVIALKEDAHNFEITKMTLELEPRIRIIIAGRKINLMQFRKYGVKAYLNGISIIDAKIGELFWNAFNEGDEKTTSYVINKLEAPFFETCVSKYGWHRSNKALLQAAGLMHRRERMPLKHINDDEFSLFINTYNKIIESWNKRCG